MQAFIDRGERGVIWSLSWEEPHAESSRAAPTENATKALITRQYDLPTPRGFGCQSFPLGRDTRHAEPQHGGASDPYNDDDGSSTSMACCWCVLRRCSSRDIRRTRVQPVLILASQSLRPCAHRRTPRPPIADRPRRCRRRWHDFDHSQVEGQTTAPLAPNDLIELLLREMLPFGSDIGWVWKGDAQVAQIPYWRTSAMRIDVRNFVSPCPVLLSRSLACCLARSPNALASWLVS